MNRTVRYAVAIVAAAVLTVGSVWGQKGYSTTNKKAIGMYEKGMQMMYRSDIGGAESQFKAAAKAEPKFAEPNIMLGEMYEEKHLDSLAAMYYQAAVDASPTFYTMAWLRLGECHLRLNHYTEAVAAFKQFLAMDKSNKEKHGEVEKLMKTVDFRQKAYANPVPFDPQNMGAAVNSKDDEYLPALTADGQTLVFTRRFPRTGKTKANSPLEEDFYVSVKKNGEWSKAVRMSEPVNSYYNEGAQCISQDGRIMIYTACNREDGAGRCDLYICHREGDKWSTPQNIGMPINTGAWETQPTFSVDGKTLYFVSDRKGGMGGMDLWQSTLQEDGSWSKPTNMGAPINTPGNEKSPFIHFDDNTFYFASDGHVGIGGLDLFVSRRNEDGSWGEPVNLGYPINTEGDESNMIVSADGRTAIYSSDKLGGYGLEDLYYFELPEDVRPQSTTYIKGIVYDSKTKKRLAADFVITDLTTSSEVVSATSDPSDGSFLMTMPGLHKYGLSVSKEGYLFYSKSFEMTVASPDDPYLLDIPLEPIEVGSSITLRNVFFETAKWDLKPESTIEMDKLVKLMNENPKMRVMLEGHTDDVGSDAANQKLSENRAKAVYDYLIEKGIAQSRLEYKGYGESKPIADNSTEEGRAQNRRTVFTVLQK
ncbi:MAG: PD40 domain-containing protein [Bacteroidales bacterium]|nr:PD40 domain-containing protein [Bacteroidales bacterium]